ncbi:MAG: hypothetical protein AAGJ46_12800 [Planctomycetota bacterium]
MPAAAGPRGEEALAGSAAFQQVWDTVYREVLYYPSPRVSDPDSDTPDRDRCDQWPIAKVLRKYQPHNPNGVSIWAYTTKRCRYAIQKWATRQRDKTRLNVDLEGEPQDDFQANESGSRWLRHFLDTCDVTLSPIERIVLVVRLSTADGDIGQWSHDYAQWVVDALGEEQRPAVLERWHTAHQRIGEGVVAKLCAVQVQAASYQLSQGAKKRYSQALECLGATREALRIACLRSVDSTASGIDADHKQAVAEGGDEAWLWREFCRNCQKAGYHYQAWLNHLRGLERIEQESLLMPLDDVVTVLGISRATAVVAWECAMQQVTLGEPSEVAGTNRRGKSNADKESVVCLEYA